MGVTPEGKLLEKLAAQAGCYISSLRDKSERERIFCLLRKMNPEEYSLREWEYTIVYLTEEKVSFTDYGELRRFLRETAG